MTSPPAAAERSHGWRRRAAAGWVRRRPLTAGLLSLILLTIVVRLVWGWHLSRQVAARLDELRRSGHPSWIAEIVIEPVPDAQNAWPKFMGAVAALKPFVDSPRNSVLEYPGYPPRGQEWEKLAAASEAANAKAFALARKARDAPSAQLRQDVSDLAKIFSDVAYNDGRTLANVVADGAEFAHLRGDDAEAVERVRDVLHLGGSMRRDPFKISQLVGIGIEAVVLESAHPIAATLAVEGTDGATGGRPATRRQVRDLISELLDEEEAAAAMVRTLISERALVVEALTQEANETWVIRPLSDHEKLRSLDIFETLIDAAKQPNHEAAKRVMARLEIERGAVRTTIFPGGSERKTKMLRYSRWFGDDAAASGMPRVLGQHYRHSAARRVAAIAFAARLYRLDHGGRWPDTLADLAPDYLTAVPADPFFEDGRPLGYVLQRGVLPDGGDRALVYFDADGSVGAIDTEPTFGWQGYPRINGKPPTRQYRDLGLWLPTTRRFEEAQRLLAAETVEDDPEEPDAPGDDEQDDAEREGPADE